MAIIGDVVSETPLKRVVSETQRETKNDVGFLCALRVSNARIEMEIDYISTCHTFQTRK